MVPGKNSRFISNWTIGSTKQSSDCEVSGLSFQGGKWGVLGGRLCLLQGGFKDLSLRAVSSPSVLLIFCMSLVDATSYHFCSPFWQNVSAVSVEGDIMVTSSLVAGHWVAMYTGGSRSSHHTQLDKTWQSLGLLAESVCWSLWVSLGPNCHLWT